MASSGQVACAIALLLSVGIASAAYFPTPPGYKVTNDASLEVQTRDGNTPRVIFIDEDDAFALEFLSTTGQKARYDRNATFYLAIVIKPFNVNEAWIPVWSANRDRPVHQNATLSVELGTSSINLVLRDADGSLVWNSTGGVFGSGRPNTNYGTELTSTGNLRFLNGQNTTAWNNWQEPTDCLLPGQTLHYGSKLISAVTGTNYASGKYHFNARVAGVTITSRTASSPSWWKSVIPTNNTLYATEHTCKYIHNTFFSAADGVVILSDTTVAPSSVQDTNLCTQTEASKTSVIASFPSASPPYDGSETVTIDQFARLEPSGFLQVYSYSVASRVYLPVSGAQAPPA